MYPIELALAAVVACRSRTCHPVGKPSMVAEAPESLAEADPTSGAEKAPDRAGKTDPVGPCLRRSSAASGRPDGPCGKDRKTCRDAVVAVVADGDVVVAGNRTRACRNRASATDGVAGAAAASTDGGSAMAIPNRNNPLD